MNKGKVADFDSVRYVIYMFVGQHEINQNKQVMGESKVRTGLCLRVGGDGGGS